MLRKTLALHKINRLGLAASALLLGQMLGTPAQAQSISSVLEQLSPQEQTAILQGAKGRTVEAAKININAPVAPQQAVNNKPASGDPLSGFGSAAAGLRPFGEALMTGNGTSYSAVLNIPVPSDYQVGPGDTIELQVFGKESRLHSLMVNREGVIMLPDIGPLSVAGMTFETASSTIIERIGKQKIGVEASVSMGPLRSIQILLAGDVDKPGTYTTHALTTVSNALLVAGGVRPSGSLRKIEVRRRGKPVAKLDLYDILLKGNANADLRLQPGDMIFVPPVGKRVAITGAVNRPAIYELLGDVSMDEVFMLSGGLLPSAFVPGTKVERLTRSGIRTMVELGSAAQTNQFAVLDGDTVQVPNSITGLAGSIKISGAVARPGDYPWAADMTLGDLLERSKLSSAAWWPLAIIRRTDPATGTRSYVPAGLTDTGTGRATELQVMDEVFVFDRSDIAFLGSASVQYVLHGKVPPSGANESTGLRVLKSNQESKEAEQRVTASLQGGIGREKLDAETKVDVQCAGLTELAYVVNQEGSSRFRSARLNLSAVKKEQLLKTLPCPSVFDTQPDLLPVVLENSITVRGEVKQPGVLAAAPGQALSLLISAAGGLTTQANENAIELSRQITSNDNLMDVDRKRLNRSQLAETMTQSGDIVVVQKRGSALDSGAVYVSGEVTNPGSFDIRRGEKLSQVLVRAGGLTAQAYAYGAVFSRASVKEEKRFFLQRAGIEMQNAVVLMMARQKRTTASSADATTLAAMKGLGDELKAIEPSGRVVVEADPTVLRLKPELDVVLEPGDEIIIPKRPSHVVVMGEVLNPGAVQFQSGLRAEDYLRAAGGTAQTGDVEHTYVILPNGAAEPLKVAAWNAQPTPIPPGSVIYVPRDPLPLDGTAMFQTVLEATKDIALTAAALVSIGRN